MMTPSTLKEAQEAFARIWQAQQDDAAARWEAMDEDDRLAAAITIFLALKQQMDEGGGYRELLDRLDMEDCYQPLYSAGAMDVNNGLPMPGDDALTQEQIEEVRRVAFEEVQKAIAEATKEMRWSPSR